MFASALKWIRGVYNKTITSIAFVPAVIALLFLGVSMLMISFDFSETGKDLKSNLSWLTLNDASTARSICSSIAAGIISLTVFSFSMVMILLGQAAGQMSNRILGKLISNRFQQTVLGFYIGTIVYALFLLTTIRDINSGIYVPAISTYLLIALTVVDIFLFIYFLHYITQSVKFDTIISRIHIDTKVSLEEGCLLKEAPAGISKPAGGIEIDSFQSGLFQGFQKSALLSLLNKENAVIYFYYPAGTYVLENAPLLYVVPENGLSDDFEEKLKSVIDIGLGQEIKTNYYYGFQQLMEIALKALSPGINDPGTASISLQAIGNLLAYRMNHFPVLCSNDKEDVTRIFNREKTFEELFDEYLLPIWDYGKGDRLIRKEMLHMLMLLDKVGKEPAVNRLLHEVLMAGRKDSV